MTARVVRSWVVVTILVCGLAGLSGRGQGGPPQIPPGRILLETSPTSRAFLVSVERLGTVRRIPIGIEVIIQGSTVNPRDPPVIPRGPSGPTYDLSQLSVRDALERIHATTVRGAVSQYVWAEHAGVFNLMPARFLAAAPTALDRRVRSGPIDFDGVREALVWIHQRFDSAYKIVRREGVQHESERLRPLIDKRLSLPSQDGTVRDVLNHLAIEHGGMLWVAEFSDPAGSYRNIRLSFVGFDNWTIMMPARVH